MAASRRAERELHFQPVDHAPATADTPPIREELILVIPERGDYRLVRRLTRLTSADSPEPAILTVSGRDAGMLLDQVDRFPVERHFPTHAGIVLQRSYRLVSRDGQDGAGDPIWDTRLIDAVAEFGAVRLDVDAGIRSLPVKIRISARSGQRLVVPRDLLAVLGWPWRPLVGYTSHWRSSIRVPKREPQRTSDIEHKLERTVCHLAETLAQPPAQFHRRHLQGRWRAALQNGIPLFAALGLIGGALALTQMPIENEAVFQMLAFYVPPLMLLLFFLGFDDLPSIEIPRVPRELPQDSWLVSVNA